MVKPVTEVVCICGVCVCGGGLGNGWGNIKRSEVLQPYLELLLGF